MTISRLVKIGGISMLLVAANAVAFKGGHDSVDGSGKFSSHKLTETLTAVDKDIQAQVSKLNEQNFDFKNREEVINVVCSKQLPVLQKSCKSLFDRYYHSYKVGKGADIEEYLRVVIKK
ncbi:predicted protein [Naegleria gruberi]|uniref:Predicted protein n=1 Tax=Naegleria gruberi TaxID=5762 RepID=D2V1J1_NAEGR|nr:uncharacterized protein NAEGRDRAFT_62598 [Naegleria gruberi]EFC49317.1 predicted protein [Naegleria gruberi]|eukprot:XP_002682061.1 predicted protein [Naegleria gruberi strain NEG-M]